MKYVEYQLRAVYSLVSENVLSLSLVRSSLSRMIMTNSACSITSRVPLRSLIHFSKASMTFSVSIFTPCFSSQLLSPFSPSGHVLARSQQFSSIFLQFDSTYRSWISVFFMLYSTLPHQILLTSLTISVISFYFCIFSTSMSSISETVSAVWYRSVYEVGLISHSKPFQFE